VVYANGPLDAIIKSVTNAQGVGNREVRDIAVTASDLENYYAGYGY
jgi:hypothetical protein